MLRERMSSNSTDTKMENGVLIDMYTYIFIKENCNGSINLIYIYIIFKRVNILLIKKINTKLKYDD